MSVKDAEQAVREGNFDAALRDLQDQVRKAPEKSELRVFLFQLLCVMGEWGRARTQLDVAAELDASTLAMAQMYREALSCEQLRIEVFSGKRSPMIFGEPDQWLALLIESLLTRATPGADQSETLRQRAFDAAPATAGSVDGQPFEWIADADMRIGPVCEAVINGRYYWVPFSRVARIELEAPVDLRDVVWMPAHFMFSNGGEAVGVIPTRYPGSESADDAQVRLARKTIWNETAPDVFHGVGQRILSTDGGDHPLMDVRSIIMEPPSVAPDPAAPDA